MTQEITCQVVAAGEFVERYVTRKLAPEEKDAFEVHLLACTHCQDEVRLVLAVREELARGTPTIERRRRLTGAGMRWGVTAAAAAVVLVAVLPRLAREAGAPDEHRAIPGVEVVGPRLLAPIGGVAHADVVLWARVVGADRYRVTLLDARGDVLWETETADTSAALPESLRLEGGVPYYWKVDARVDWERWLKSTVAEFELPPAGSGPQRLEDPE